MDKCLFGSASNVGIVRSENQDSVYVGKNEFGNIIAIVCDGLGGYKGGAIASSIVCDLFKEAFLAFDFTSKSDKDIESWFSTTLRKSRYAIKEYVEANNKEFKLKNDGATLEQMATTIVLSLIANKKVYTYWVGDSRAYLINKKNESWQITLDHNLYNALKSINATEETFHRHAKELLALTNIISKDVQSTESFGISIHEPKLKERYLLLCSDGFYNFVAAELFYKLISEKSYDLNAASEHLLDVAMKNMSNDNLTVVLVDLAGTIHGK